MTRPMTPDELTEVERIVNEKIVENRPVHIFVTERETARQLGAMMLFGEKYGEHVRVVEIPEFSKELCGGTHVRSTAEIGAFVILREASSSQGVRRIEAIAGQVAIDHLRERSSEADHLEGEVAELRSQVKKLQRPGGGGGAAAGNGRESALLESAGEEGGIRIVTAVVEDVDPEALLQVSDRLKAQAGAGRGRAGQRGRGQGSPAGERRPVRDRPRPLGRRPDQADRADRWRRRWRPGDHGAGRRERSRQAARGRRGGRERDPDEAAQHGMRVIALDYGRARTGVAISDPTGTLARPLGVVERVRTPAGMDELIRLIDDAEAALVVVGLPLTLAGETGAQASETLDFVRELRERCGTPVETEDERFTTSLARSTVGPGRPDDAVAAAHLLEGYLRRLAG